MDYVNSLEQQIENNSYNLAANIKFQETGESLGEIVQDSKNLGSLKRSQMIAFISPRLSQYVSGVNNALAQMSDDLIRFVYSYTQSNYAAMVKIVQELGKGSMLQGQIFYIAMQGLYNRASLIPVGMQEDINAAEQAAQREAAGDDGGADGKGIKGRGLKTPSKRRKVVPILGKGVGQKAPQFVEFGKYKIDKTRLGDNSVDVRYVHGGKISTYPTRMVGGNVGAVLRSIVDQKQPSFDEMSTLNEEEKQYLHGLIKRSNIDHSFLPNVNKKEEEEMMTHFETLKGELMSGNDNKEMVKNFKICLMKMSRLGKLTHAEVNDILLDLMSQGL